MREMERSLNGSATFSPTAMMMMPSYSTNSPVTIASHNATFSGMSNPEDSIHGGSVVVCTCCGKHVPREVVAFIPRNSLPTTVKKNVVKPPPQQQQQSSPKRGRLLEEIKEKWKI
jgi:hypothetical protein